MENKTKSILSEAISNRAALKSMGLEAEYDDFAKEMEARASAVEERRASAVLPNSPAKPYSMSTQTPITSRRRRGVPTQQQSVIPPGNVTSGVNHDELAAMLSMTPDQKDTIDRARMMVSKAQQEYVDRAMAEVKAERELDEKIMSGDISASSVIMDRPDVRQSAEAPVAEEKPHEPAKPAVPGPSVQAAHSNHADFDAFAEITGLPSRGLAYSDRIYGQSLRLGDMLILGFMNDSNSVKYIDTIFERHIRGSLPGDVLSCDELYIMHWLRASSYPMSGMYGPPYVCKTCGYHSANDEPYTVGFNDLVFTINADPAKIIEKHRGNGYVTINTYDGRECHIYLRRRRHGNDISNAKASWKKQYGENMPAYYEMALAMAAVVEIEDIEGIIPKMQYIFDYPTSERKSFIDAVSESSLSTTVKARVACPMCGGVAEWPYPFRTENFLSGI